MRNNRITRNTRPSAVGQTFPRPLGVKAFRTAAPPALTLVNNQDYEEIDQIRRLGTGDFFPYTIVSGDTLSAIALRRYGSSSIWPHIYVINHTSRGGQLGDNPNEIQIGQQIDLADTPGELYGRSRLTQEEHAALRSGPPWPIPVIATTEAGLFSTKNIIRALLIATAAGAGIWGYKKYKK